jgi:hypothetical protein
MAMRDCDTTPLPRGSTLTSASLLTLLSAPEHVQCQKIGRYLNEMMQLPGILDIEEVRRIASSPTVRGRT